MIDEKAILMLERSILKHRDDGWPAIHHGDEKISPVR